MEAANIRIDATLLQANQGKLVRIIGKCESFDRHSNIATLISNGPITLEIPMEINMEITKNYEIIGKVSSNSSNLNVHVFSVIELSDNLNLDVAQKLVQYVHKVPELFFD
ncbi:uncharacterized protein J8A68_000346 [[Candida] subhashii]|uniref:Replication factor A protein 3 n=1 Tax=[Candida] subhashii TaxID=561895 RepID=A0A8J5QWX5_9ASCO|nr:uncharacterized protein J8A68_000346 [[Candida] subhashii]KAG7666090.1 hypothetical protein J8A68_000346 [[Candida] subhashii]